MVTDSHCQRSDLPASMCAHCRGLDAVDVVDLDELPARPGSRRRPLSSSFYGTCKTCDAQILPGDTVYRNGLGYDCEECADA